MLRSWGHRSQGWDRQADCQASRTRLGMHDGAWTTHHPLPCPSGLVVQRPPTAEAPAWPDSSPFWGPLPRGFRSSSSDSDSPSSATATGTAFRGWVGSRESCVQDPREEK